MSRRVSAGIMLYRQHGGEIEVLLAHPGGPFFAGRDLGHWTIPKGEPDSTDDLPAAAAREFAEETGHSIAAVARDPLAEPVPLGSVTQASGKVVHAWAVEGDLDPEAATSNTFSMVWPPGASSPRTFPEIDRVAWFTIHEARRRTNRSQEAFVERLAAFLAVGHGDEAG